MAIESFEAAGWTSGAEGAPGHAFEAPRRALAGWVVLGGPSERGQAQERLAEAIGAARAMADPARAERCSGTRTAGRDLCRDYLLEHLVDKVRRDSGRRNRVS